jgi:inosine-uridine nucleoside N-ribohydrolase
VENLEISFNKFIFESLKTVRRSIILDTDIGPDCDDAGAMAIMYNLAKRYNTKVLGINCCSSNQYGPGCIDAINNFCGFASTPIGTYKNPVI